MTYAYKIRELNVGVIKAPKEFLIGVAKNTIIHYNEGDYTFFIDGKAHTNAEFLKEMNEE